MVKAALRYNYLGLWYEEMFLSYADGPNKIMSLSKKNLPGSERGRGCGNESQSRVEGDVLRRGKEIWKRDMDSTVEAPGREISSADALILPGVTGTHGLKS